MDDRQGAERQHPYAGSIECVSGVGPSRREWAATVQVLTRTGDRRARRGVHRPRPASDRLLVDAALDLWNGDRSTSLYDAVTRLDDPNFARLVEALRLRRPQPAQSDA
jgi:hypothetical protein